MADEDNGTNWLKMIAVFVLIVVIAAGTSYGVMVYLTSEDNGEEQKNEMGPTHSLGEFTVNLSQNRSGYQIIKAEITLETNNEEVIEELEKKSPQIRDSIISIFREADEQEIEESNAKVIKSRILSNLNDILGSGEVKNVWFTSLVVQ